MIDSPQFSIVLPTYNRPSILKEFIAGIQHQTFARWELVIVDDSTNSSEKLIGEINDPRVRYVNRGEKFGVSSARNFGAAQAIGKYLAFIDDDDRVSREWLAEFSVLIEKNQSPDIVYCAMEKIDPFTRKVDTFYPSSKELWRIIYPGAWVISRVFFESLGKYDERLLFGENTELFFRIRAANPKSAFTDSVLFYYYQSPDGGSKNIQNKIDSTTIVLKKHKELISKNKDLERVLVQVVGVAFLRLNNFEEARKYLLRAYLLNPYKLRALLRLVVAYLPFISKRIYLST